MDHERLHGRQKGLFWSLMSKAKVVNSSKFRRKDLIINTARQIPRFCTEPLKQVEKTKPGPSLSPDKNLDK